MPGSDMVACLLVASNVTEIIWRASPGLCFFNSSSERVVHVNKVRSGSSARDKVAVATSGLSEASECS